MTKKTCITVSEVNREKYVQGLSKFKHSLFITSEWVESFANQKETGVIYLEFLQKGEVVAKLVGLSKKEPKLIGRYLYFYSGPGFVNGNEELYNQCLSALLKFAKKKRFTRIEIDYKDQQYQWNCKVKGYYKKSAFNFIRYFNTSGEAFNYGKSFRYKVRKAENSGALFYEENSERILNRLHELLKESREMREKRWGKQYCPYPFPFMNRESTNQLFKSGYLKLQHVEIDGIVHAVSCSLDDGVRMYGLIIAADEVSYNLYLQHFMKFKLFELLEERGYLYFNVGSTDHPGSGKGLAIFKESLGCKHFGVSGVYTHFLCFPDNAINPVMNFGRLLVRNKRLSKIVELGSKIVSEKNM